MKKRKNCDKIKIVILAWKKSGYDVFAISPISRNAGTACQNRTVPLQGLRTNRKTREKFIIISKSAGYKFRGLWFRHHNVSVIFDFRCILQRWKIPVSLIAFVWDKDVRREYKNYSNFLKSNQSHSKVFDSLAFRNNIAVDVNTWSVWQTPIFGRSNN